MPWEDAEPLETEGKLLDEPADPELEGKLLDAPPDEETDGRLLDELLELEAPGDGMLLDELLEDDELLVVGKLLDELDDELEEDGMLGIPPELDDVCCGDWQANAAMAIPIASKVGLSSTLLILFILFILFICPLALSNAQVVSISL